jgi:hypothetical protein
MLSAIDLVRVESREVVRDVTVARGDSGHADAVVRAFVTAVAPTFGGNRGRRGGRRRRWKRCAEHGSRLPSPSRTLARFVESSGRQRQLRLDCLPERVEQRERHTRSR